MAQKNRISLSLENKYQLIMLMEQEESKTKTPTSLRKATELFFERFGIKISKSAVGNIWNDRQKHKEEYESNMLHSRKRARLGKWETIDEAVWAWFVIARAKNVPISGAIIFQKARNIADGLGITDFKSSEGWLTGWKSRFGVKMRVISGEASDVPAASVEDWLKRVPELCAGYSAENIFNADETGLIYKGLPTKSLVAKADSCMGGKLSKERLTVLLCANSMGEKLKPLVIGKSAKPRAFKSINTILLPVTWRSNRKAWMTAELFKEWLKALNAQMKKEKRKILLYVDNCASHPDIEFSHILVRFLPPNTTSRLQPLDQGVIQNFKLAYRRLLMQNLVDRLESCSTASDLVAKITVLDAVMWIAEAWQSVKPETIQKCFKKGGFPATIADEEEGFGGFEETDVAAIDDLIEMFKKTVNMRDESINALEYVSADNHVSTEQLYDEGWEEKFMAELRNVEEDILVSEDEPEPIEEIAEGPTTTTEALAFARGLKKFAVESMPQLLPKLYSIESEILAEKAKNIKQKTITDYFKNQEGPDNA